MYLSMKSIGNYLVIFVDGKSMPLKIFLSLNLSFELYHLYKSLLPSVRGLSIYFMQLFIFVESPSSLIKHQLGNIIGILVHGM